MKNNLELHTQLEKVVTTFLAAKAVSPSKPVHLLLALSGGVDSIVLLHELKALSSQLPFSLSAMHVHHGLSPNADDWLTLCERTCVEENIPFHAEKVNVDLNSGLGVEATAREARYQALERLRQNISADAIVTAHHMQDQSETILLQLVRGAGVKGLAAMAAWDDSRNLLRPLLHVSKTDILQQASNLQCQWVEDESNTDISYDRNFMRQNVMPMMRERYPQLDNALVRTVGHMAEAQSLLDILASQDISACDVRSEWLGQSVDIQRLHLLGDVRAKNMLRYWFQQLNLRMPNTEQLHNYWQQLSTVKPHRYLHLPLHEQCGSQLAYLHHYQQRLYCVRKPSALPSTPLVWNGEKSQVWGEWQVEFKVSKGKGIALARLGVSPAAITLNKRYGQTILLADGIELTLSSRTGGEQLQPDAKRPRRELKVIFQMLGVPPWQRAFYPLVHAISAQASVSQTLVSLASLAVDAAWQPGRNAYGLEISLHPL